jgi:hypothetical protein
MHLTFHRDQPEVFLAILREVGQWLVDSGQEMWQLHAYPRQPVRRIHAG